MSKPKDDSQALFTKHLDAFVGAIKASMEHALICAVMAIEHYAAHEDLSYCQRFLDAMPKNFTRRTAFLKWLAAHSPITIEDGKLKKDKADDAVPFNVEAAKAKPFWEFAPDQEDIVLSDNDAFKRLMQAIKYFRRDNVTTTERTTQLVNEVEKLVDTAKAQSEQAGTDEATERFSDEPNKTPAAAVG